MKKDFAPDNLVKIEEVENEIAPELILFADWETYEDAAME